jgi:hypothetical protein
MLLVAGQLHSFDAGPAETAFPEIEVVRLAEACRPAAAAVLAALVLSGEHTPLRLARETL